MTSWSKLGMRALKVAARQERNDAGKLLTKQGATPSLYHVACCYLARPSEPATQCLATCNQHRGYTLRSWDCCYGTYYYSCAECTSATTCETGPFICSSAQRVQGVSC